MAIPSLNSKKRLQPYTLTLVATANSKNVANIRWAPDRKFTLLESVPDGTEATVITQLGRTGTRHSCPALPWAS